MKQNGKDSIKKLVKSTLERYSSGNVNAQTLKNILGAKGYTVIRYSALDVSEETERLMSTLGVTEISRQTDSFTYLDNVRRIVFIRKDISDDEFLYLLALELGRILTTSFRSSCIVSGNSQDEAQAREFAFHVSDIAQHGILYNISKFYPVQTVVASAAAAAFISVFACMSFVFPRLYDSQSRAYGIDDTAVTAAQNLNTDENLLQNVTNDTNAAALQSEKQGNANLSSDTDRAAMQDLTAQQSESAPQHSSAEKTEAEVLPESNEQSAAKDNPSYEVNTEGGTLTETPGMEDSSVRDFVVPEDQRVYYVTSNGTKYHLPGCSYIKDKDVKPITYDEIEKGGYTPCSRCFG